MVVFPRIRKVVVSWKVPWRVGCVGVDRTVTVPRKQETTRMHPTRTVVVFIWPVDELRVKKAFQGIA
jgi:hypothetical protein